MSNLNCATLASVCDVSESRLARSATDDGARVLFAAMAKTMVDLLGKAGRGFDKYFNELAETRARRYDRGDSCK